MRITLAHANARLAATRDAIDTGAGPGGIELRTGPAPVSIASPAAGTLLARIDFQKPCGTIADAAMTLLVASDAVAVATGTVGHARWVDGDGNTIGDSSVSVLAGAAEVRLSSLELEVGYLVGTVAATIG